MIHAGGELFLRQPAAAAEVRPARRLQPDFPPTAGATVNLGVIDLEFATYGVDVSTTGQPIEDRRFLGSLSTSF